MDVEQRLERVEGIVDRMSDLIDAIFEVMIVVHPNDQQLVKAAQDAARSRLRLIHNRREAAARRPRGPGSAKVVFVPILLALAELASMA